jgi:hypothetical protein
MAAPNLASRAAGCLRVLGPIGVVLARTLLGATIAGGLLALCGFAAMLARGGRPMRPEVRLV